MNERFRGCLVGLALGDSLGAAFEGMPPGDYEPSCKAPLFYTDDTEMMLNLSESIIERGEVVPEDLARHFIEGLNPQRGYGYGTLRVLSLIRSGVPIDRATSMVFREGSKGNGASMRVAPVGLLYWFDRERIVEAATRASTVTHTHPVAIDGAVAIALSVGMILQGGSREQIPGEIIKYMKTNLMKGKIDALMGLLERGCSREEVIRLLGNGVLTEESVPTAIYCFLRYGDDFMRAIGFSISLGGDTDTISAMTGALCGAWLSRGALPPECVERLEDRERIISNADGLYELSEAIYRDFSKHGE